MDKPYNPWPCGKLRPEQQRPELGMLKVKFDDPREVVEIFERKIADFAGSKYAVAVDSCTNALFLSLKCCSAHGTVAIPARNYCSVPMAIIHAGCLPLLLRSLRWSGVYMLEPFKIIDGAGRFRRGMYDFRMQGLHF